MNPEALKTMIAGGEDSHTEFKSAAVHQDRLAKAVVAFANMQGGRILVGVEDDGRVSGIGHPSELVEHVAVSHHQLLKT